MPQIGGIEMSFEGIGLGQAELWGEKEGRILFEQN